MIRSSLILAAAFVAAALPAGAQMMSGSGAMDPGNFHYYVGTWACMAGNVGQRPMNATATFTMDAGLLREHVNVAAMGKMKYAYTLEIAQTFDPKHHRMVATGLGNDGGYWVSYAKPWTEHTEEWVDAFNRDGLGRSETVRESQNRFSFMDWDKTMGGKVVFKGYCTRSS